MQLLFRSLEPRTGWVQSMILRMWCCYWRPRRADGLLGSTYLPAVGLLVHNQMTWVLARGYFCIACSTMSSLDGAGSAANGFVETVCCWETFGGHWKGCALNFLGQVFAFNLHQWFHPDDRFRHGDAIPCCIWFC